MKECRLRNKKVIIGVNRSVNPPFQPSLSTWLKLRYGEIFIFGENSWASKIGKTISKVHYSPLNQDPGELTLERCSWLCWRKDSSCTSAPMSGNLRNSLWIRCWHSHCRIFGRNATTHTHICLYFWRIHGRTITKEQHAFAKQTYKFLCVIICRHTWGAVPRTSGYVHHKLKNHIFSVHILIIRKKQWKSPQSPNISPWSGWYYFTKLKFVATNFPQSTNWALLQFTRDFCEAAPQDLRLEDHWRSSE